MFSPECWQNKPLAATHPFTAYPVGSVCLICCQTGWPRFRCCRTLGLSTWYLASSLLMSLCAVSHQHLYLVVATCFNDMILEYLRGGGRLFERPLVSLCPEVDAQMSVISIFTRASCVKSSVPQEIAHSGCVGQAMCWREKVRET